MANQTITINNITTALDGQISALDLLSGTSSYIRREILFLVYILPIFAMLAEIRRIRFQVRKLSDACSQPSGAGCGTVAAMPSRFLDGFSNLAKKVYGLNEALENIRLAKPLNRIISSEAEEWSELVEELHFAVDPEFRNLTSQIYSAM